MSWGNKGNTEVCFHNIRSYSHRPRSRSVTPGNHGSLGKNVHFLTSWQVVALGCWQLPGEIGCAWNCFDLQQIAALELISDQISHYFCFTSDTFRNHPKQNNPPNTQANLWLRDRPSHYDFCDTGFKCNSYFSFLISFSSACVYVCLAVCNKTKTPSWKVLKCSTEQRGKE